MGERGSNTRKVTITGEVLIWSFDTGNRFQWIGSMSLGPWIA
jgi:hypothetical protein